MSEKFVNAPMIGKVLKVKVKPGDTVNVNQPVLVMESMKVEMDVVSPYQGKVQAVLVAEGDTIEADAKLILFE